MRPSLPLTSRPFFAGGRPLLADDDTPIRAGDWHNTRYHTHRFMIESRLLQLLKENAFNIQERVGSNSSKNIKDYQVIPSLLEAYCREETPNLNKWTPHAHGKARRPIAGAALEQHQRRMEREAKERAAAPTDGKEQQRARQGRTPGRPSLEDDQVREIRSQAAQTPEADRLRLYAELAAKFGRHEKVIQECAEGKTYKRLPLTAAYLSQQQTPKQPGKHKVRETTSQAAETTTTG